ncbi:MAG: signal peptide peptidase SppA [Bacteroidales bacterium]|nr:signal peptide peptidase SppA [Bacteroidales bacterium]
MKNFWKYFFASLLGSFLSLLLIFLVVFGVFSMMLSTFSKPEATVPENAVLSINLNQAVPDKTPDNPFEDFDFVNFESNKALGLNDILKTLTKAKDDENIKGIFLDLDYVQAGMATVEEIRNKLVEFKESGKFIICYASVYTQKSYYLASVADKIYLNPVGSMDWKGMYSQVMFFKGALDKLEIEAQIFRHGKFKSAIEPFITDKMSEANKEQTLVYTQSLWNRILSGVSDSRGISVDLLNQYADSLAIRKADDALRLGFVDALKYRDEVLDELRAEAENDDDKDDFDFIVKIDKYFKVPIEKEKKKKLPKDRIAVIFAEGNIVDGKGGTGKIGGDAMSYEIRKARLDEDVKAIVLRVNSPGGSGLASEIIWRELEEAGKTKPIVVSMGNLAASGGYYISCNSDYIFAQPNTLTGSIGVFGMIPNMQGFLNNKLRITTDGVGTNANSSMGDISRPFNEFEKQNIQFMIEDFYDTFIGRVADGRKMTKEDVDEIGQGRVWSGENALGIGLVDEIGGLDDAVKKAVELAGCDDYRIKELPEAKDFFEMMSEDMMMSLKTYFVNKALGTEYIYYETIENVKTMSGVQARLPYEIEVY